MANSKLKSSTQEREIPKEENGDFESENDFCIPDDSDEDPTFDILEETRSRLLKISIKKSRKVKELDSESEDGEDLDSFGVEIPELNEKDGKCFEKVEELMRDGQLEKLKIEQCKVYLRKYGLRLTGNKGILIERIKEHLGVVNGGGEKKYPISSFVLNCQGDACTGDVVMFEQKVYEMFNIASRSASGPPCGTRIVAGRIVKESYGAAKQQHTFTIEVLWSTGEKPLPPLHPLLIKGRNLYRLKTLRQRWADEEERRKVIQEKHSRGFIARCSRETRIKEKEDKKIGIVKRIESKINQHQKQPVHAKVVQHQDKINNVVLQHHVNPNTSYQHQGNPVQAKVTQQQNIHHHHQFHHQQMAPNVIPRPMQNHPHQIQHLQKENVPEAQANIWTGYSKPHYNIAHISKPHEFHHRQPPSLSSSNSFMWSQTSQRNWCQLRQWCRYYLQGRCHYGDNCKYLHE